MIPLTFLAGVLALTLAAFLGHLFLRRRLSEGYRQLAAEHRMQYAERDLFQITPRVVEKFPIPGASDIRVMDVIYQRRDEEYRYFFTIEFTLGVVRTKRRARRAGMLSEPRDRTQCAEWSALKLGPAEVGLIKQYGQLCGEKCPDQMPAPLA
jgi:hypothetical protein